MALFITFEGGEGCGKSYQSKALYNKLYNLGIAVDLTYEPGGTALGNEVRRLLKKRRQGVVSPEAELFLFAACRAQLIADVIQPGLQKDKVIICDRFSDSTIAYQGYGRGIDLAIIKMINLSATQNIKPNLTILLDLPVEQGLRRKKTKSKDRFEGAGLIFHNRVREGYLKLAAEEPERWLVIDATLSKAEISNIIWKRVSQMLVSVQS